MRSEVSAQDYCLMRQNGSVTCNKVSKINIFLSEVTGQIWKSGCRAVPRFGGWQRRWVQSLPLCQASQALETSCSPAMAVSLATGSTMRQQSPCLAVITACMCLDIGIYGRPCMIGSHAKHQLAATVLPAYYQYLHIALTLAVGRQLSEQLSLLL